MTIQKGESNGGDTPLLTPGQPGETSSLGLFWPPKETDYYRAKGFFKKAILSPTHFDRFMWKWNSLVESDRFTTNGREETNDEKDKKNYSRVTLRAVVANEFLQIHSGELQEMVEAIIPLEGGVGNVFACTSLVYFGKNHPNRKSDDNTNKSCIENVRNALSEEERTPEQMIATAKNNGYTLRHIDKNKVYTNTNKEVQQLFALYQPFGWSQAQVVELLNSPNRLIAVAKKDGVIVSAGIAEMATESIRFDRNQSCALDMVELTDAATLVVHERKGLYSAVSTILLQKLAKKYHNSPNELIIFGESNASAKGVLRTSKHQGRTFAAQIGRDFGYGESGMLNQHVPILDRGEKIETARDRYNNFYPTFINKSKLLSKYGNN
ncbi:hypothetical protein COY90_03755 [Candidatus Roizmanbacteria bacterium CG_4_10_14_0_8_um_filter_39_9]|uniref:Uncharacterized protein n=1 Tax=Candidatus Roizmanbacteria bacterium CG_4_10_14_0_8_um_filter_39_9 TaxID=1974829 RepID=A0A2M7QCA4_9BACT|nr:MAG: hypothetical protein COY90_03755 [Candidatus Roizmanbacteria bacterium CG_4_10_14_0_8_um_filter_39_9]